MGVSIEIWRARVGAFHPVMLSLTRERKVRKKQRLFRTYKRPPDDAKTHHVSLHILICLLSLLVACFSSRSDPLGNVRRLGPDILVMNATVMYLGVSHGEAGTWRERLTLGLRMAFFVMLLMCGDVESNPGPKDSKTKVQIEKKIIKLYCVDKNQKIGLAVGSLEELHQKIRDKWPDLSNETYTIQEKDGTEVSDEDYFIQLVNRSTLDLHSKNQDCVRKPQLNASAATVFKLDLGLSDEVILEIVTRLASNITKLGVTMGFGFTETQKYRELNREDIVSCPGTLQMIHDWCRNTKRNCQVEELCKFLADAGQVELADDLRNDRILNRDRIAQTSTLNQLQSALEQVYVMRLCFARTIPWKMDSAVPINNLFKTLTLFYREKTSKRESMRTDDLRGLPHYADKGDKIGFFNSEDKLTTTETRTFLTNSHNDIFSIKQNGLCPRRIMIKGDPGVGKSTLLLKLAHDWAIVSETSPLRYVKLLIHLNLKGVEIHANIGDEVMRQLLPEDSPFKGKQIEDIIRQNLHDTVLLLDGFDESIFATPSGQADGNSYGTLYDAIRSKQFTTCRIVVSVRSWKESHFRGGLFNWYAEILVSGLTPISIKEFIHDYCNVNHAAQTKDVINKDLTNLRPILRVPLFLAMICEMVSNAAYTKPRAILTLTNLIQQFCTYLFKQFKDRYSKPYDDNTCLTELGKLAQGAYVIEIETPTGVIEDSLTIGLLSKVRMKYESDKGEKQKYYFAHSLLRDYCVARYMSFCDKPGNPHRLMDNYYVTLFECGIRHTKLKLVLEHAIQSPSCISLIPDHRKHYRPKDFTRELLAIQCYFENRSLVTSGSDVDLAFFRQLKCIAVQMDHLNSLSAVQSVLSALGDSENSISEFALLCENYVHIVDNNMKEDADDFTTRLLEINDVSQLIRKCSNLTSIYIKDCKLTLEKYTEDFDSRFHNLTEINIISCRGYNAIRNMIWYVMHYFPHLKMLRLQGVYCSRSDAEMLIVQDTISLLGKVAPQLNRVYLINMGTWLSKSMAIQNTQTAPWCCQDVDVSVNKERLDRFPNIVQGIMTLVQKNPNLEAVSARGVSNEFAAEITLRSKDEETPTSAY